jgi:HSP20 family molecular chaperone IbpA
MTETKELQAKGKVEVPASAEQIKPGPINRPEEDDILIEYQFGRYYRQFTLAEVIDQGKIDAALNGGVLRLSLPKLEKAMPRQITIKAG